MPSICEESAIARGRPLAKGLAYGSLARDLTVGVVLAPGAALNHLFLHGALELRRAAWEFLCDAVASAAEAHATEARSAPAPPDPTLALVHARLCDLRAEVRRTASPRAVARLGHCTLSPSPAGRALHYHEHRRWVPARSRGSVEPALRLSLARIRDEPLPVPTCACGADAPCTHLLAAIDLALAQLAGPDPGPAWFALARELDTPQWHRALAGLDLLRLDRRYESEAEVEVRYSFVVAESYPDRVTIAPYLHRRKRDGGFGKGKRVSPADLQNGPGPCPPEDRIALAVLGFLAGGSGGSGYAYGYAWSSYEGRRPEELLTLAGHPRVFRGANGADPISVQPADLGLLVRPCDGGGAELVPTVAGRAVPAKDVLDRLQALRSGATFLWHERERRELLGVKVADPDAMRLALGGIVQHGQRFPSEAETALLERVEALQPVLPVAIAPDLEGEEVAASGQHVLRLGLRDTGLDLALFTRPLPGARPFSPGDGPARVLGLRAGHRVFARRDLATERRLAGDLAAALPLGGASQTREFAWTIGDDESALAVVEALSALDRPDLEVEWIGPPPRVVKGGAPQLRVKVRDRLDWFGLAGTVEVDGEEVELAALLAALRDRRRVLRLKGGAWLALTGELADRLAPLAQLSIADGDEVEIGPAALGVIDDLARDGADLDASGAFARLLARMREASRGTPRVPRAFKGKLRDYQVEGFRWLARLSAWGAGAVLADDMGLGKTLQALALLCHRAEQGPALVVAPTSVCANWVAEARRFAPSLRVSLFREIDRASAVAGLGPGDVLVVSYGLLTLDLERFAGKRFATLVLDEAQAVKNAGTRRARATRTIAADFTVALSGTPIENHLGELWSLYRIAFPGLLGSWDRFRRRFARPIEQDGDRASKAALAATIRPFLLRRTKAEVARELPTRTEVALSVALSSGERRMYEDARLAAIARLAGSAARVRPEQRRFQVLAAITELRLLACHPRLHDPESSLPSSKLARFLELATELVEAGHRTLVFSQFTSHLALVREALDAAGASYLYLDGQTPPAERDRLVARFQAGEGQHFLISLKAGGTGINLTAADYVIHLDPWWNPAVEDQATDRAHRIGQTRPVTVYRLVSEGTIEETMVELHARKRELVAGILDGMDAAGRLSADELLALIRSDPRGDVTGTGAAVDVELAREAPPETTEAAGQCPLPRHVSEAVAHAVREQLRTRPLRARRG